MPVVTVIRKEIKSDGTIKTVTEKQQRDEHGNVIRVISRTTETRRPGSTSQSINNSNNNNIDSTDIPVFLNKITAM
jgi:hypothetical protein